MKYKVGDRFFVPDEATLIAKGWQARTSALGTPILNKEIYSSIPYSVLEQEIEITQTFQDPHVYVFGYPTTVLFGILERHMEDLSSVYGNSIAKDLVTPIKACTCGGVKCRLPCYSWCDLQRS